MTPDDENYEIWRASIDDDEEDETINEQEDTYERE